MYNSVLAANVSAIVCSPFVTAGFQASQMVDWTNESQRDGRIVCVRNSDAT